MGAELSVAIVRGLGVYGSAAKLKTSVDGVGYAGSGTGWELGVRGGLTLAGPWGLAADVRAGAGASEDGEGGETAVKTRAARLLGTVGAPGGGAMAWLGPDYQWGSSIDLAMPSTAVQGETLAYTIEPLRPVAVVLGGSLHSGAVGLPWRTSPRLSAGAELQAGQVRAVRAWVGLGL